ncbi:MAG: glutamate-cysteine ligase family protein [Halanaerobiaceae bacterium]
MNYNRKINTIINILNSGEKNKDKFKIGVEIEHLILDKNLFAVNYSQPQGIHTVLKKLTAKHWKPGLENGNIIELKKNNNKITLEPGGQIELSIKPVKQVSRAAKIYSSFLQDLLPIINNYNYRLATIGFQPKTKINSIKLLPKKRYNFMHKYLSRQGKLAPTMMRGTASLQVNIDYSSEKNYHKKYYAAAYLVPILYSFFDNSPFQAGSPVGRGSFRAKIWANTDSERCGFIKSLYQPGSGYREYAKFLLNTPPIIIKRAGKLIYTGDKLFKDVINFHSQEELDHGLSMVFPEIRSKKFLEIRSADTLPYPWNMGYTAFIKNIFYNQENLNYVYEMALNNNYRQLQNLQKKIIDVNLPEEIKTSGKKIFLQVRENSLPEDREYLEHIAPFFLRPTNPRTITLNNFRNKNNLPRALDWCIMGGETGE